MSARPQGRRRRRPEEPANHERWLVSYADFITLLFAFFTVLYAISTVDAKKLAAMVDSMQTAFPAGPSPTPGGQGAAPAAAPGGGTPAATSADLAVLQGRLQGTLARAIADKRVDVERRGDTLVISIREVGAFPVGSADLSSDARALLMDVGATLAAFDQSIRVEGHTDDTPIHTARFASNWELSTTRATNVIAFLIEHAGVRPERLSAAGYAAYHPRADNTSELNRVRNRRVDIVIVGTER